MAITACVNGGAYTVTFSAGSPANNKGSWATLHNSLPEDVKYLIINFAKIHNGGGKKALIDIGIGGAGSETVLIPNIMASNTAFWETGMGTLIIPCYIAAGTRLAVRGQCSTASETLEVSVHVVGGSGSATPVYTYGADTTDSGGATIDCGAVASTYSGWVELSAGVTAQIDWIAIIASGRGNTGLPAGGVWAIDIGTGAAGSESVIVNSVVATSSPDAFGTGKMTPCVWAFPLPTPILVGTRLAARAAHDTTDATDRLIDVVVIGITGASVP